MKNYYFEEAKDSFEEQYNSYALIDKSNDETILLIEFFDNENVWVVAFNDENSLLLNIYKKYKFNNIKNDYVVFPTIKTAISHIEQFINYYEQYLVFL